MLSELKNLNTDLKKENSFLKNKNTFLLANANAYAVEKKKYLDSEMNIIEKEIKFEKYKNPSADRSDTKKLIVEISKIVEKLSKENRISDLALEEIFKDSKKTAHLFNLIRVGEKNELNPEVISKNKIKR